MSLHFLLYFRKS